MKLRIITGRHGTGKTHKVYDEIGQAISNGLSSQLLIVPELFTHTAEREILRSLKLDGMLSLQVLSPSRLQSRIFDETGGRTLARLDRRGRCMIIRKCINEHSDEMSIYGRIYESNAFAEELLDSIIEFKQCDITVEQLAEATASTDDALLRSKLEVLCTVYQAYEQHMSGNYLDEEGCTSLMIDKLASSELIRNSDIWLDGFDRFNPLNLRLIKALLENAKSLTVTLTVCSEADDDAPAFFAQIQSMIALRRIADELGSQFESITMPASPYRVDALTHLERNLYSREMRKYDGGNNAVHIYRHASQYEEIENTALMLRKLARSGIKYSQMAVVCHNFETLAPMISRVFGKCGIPYFTDIKRPISAHPVIVMLKSAFDIIENGHRSEDVFRYAKTGFAADVSDGMLGRFENYCRENGVSGKKRFVNPLERGTEDEISEFEPLRQALMHNVTLLHQDLTSNRRADAMACALRTFIERSGIEERLAATTDRLNELSGVDDTFAYREMIEESAQILSDINEAIDDMINLISETHLSMRSFFSIMRAAFDACDIGIIPTAQEQVIIGDIKRTETPDIKVMFILANNSEYFPSTDADTGFISRKERDLLTMYGINTDRDTRLMRALERFDMHSTVSKPAAELYVSYSDSDLDRKPLHASSVVARILSVFPDVKVESADEELCLYAKPIACDRLLARLKAEQGGTPLTVFWQSVYSALREDEACNKRITSFEKALRFENRPRSLSRDVVERLYRGRVSSASQLENYAACPYRFYLDYGLRPVPRREYGVLRTDSGTIYHEALSQYVELLIRLGSDAESMTREESDMHAQNIFNDVCTRFRQGLLGDSAQLSAMTARMSAVFKSTAWAVLEQVRSSKFKPAATEISFGKGGTFPPIIINTRGGEELQICGKIDRVDRYSDENGTHISIVDYKSGDKKISTTDIENGTELQLMLYMGAVIDNIAEENTHPAGAFYMHIHNPIVSGNSIIEEARSKAFRQSGIMSSEGAIERGEASKFVSGKSLNEEDFKHLIDIALQNASEISSRALDGLIPLEPLKDSVRACKFCDYKSICRFSKEYSGNRERVAESAFVDTENGGEV